jgi:ribosomal-protein-serine acetyltransferase
MDAVLLKDDVITLRPLRMSDALEVFLAVEESMASLSPWMPWCYPGYSIVDSEGWSKASAVGWKESSAYEFAITDSRGWLFYRGLRAESHQQDRQGCQLGLLGQEQPP